MFTVTALTIERYTCLNEKRTHENEKSKQRILIGYITFVWILAICFTLPKAISITVRFDEDSGLFKCDSHLNDTKEKLYTISKMVLAFALPYSIIIVFTLLLLKFLREWSKNAMRLRGGGSTMTAKRPSEPEIRRKSACETAFVALEPVKEGPEQQQPHQKPLLAQKNRSPVSLSKSKGKPKTELRVNVLANLKACTNNQNQRLLKMKRRTTRFVLAVVFSVLESFFSSNKSDCFIYTYQYFFLNQNDKLM